MPTRNKNIPMQKGIVKPKDGKTAQRSRAPETETDNKHIMTINVPTHVKAIPITVLFITNSLSELIYASVFACCNSTIRI